MTNSESAAPLPPKGKVRRYLFAGAAPGPFEGCGPCLAAELDARSVKVAQIAASSWHRSALTFSRRALMGFCPRQLLAQQGTEQ